ncbi:MAG TPA: hypothetical protein DCM45_03175 [Clostridiales bacterium]|nr:hypothetical protein [Clostridiales bacterium]
MNDQIEQLNQWLTGLDSKNPAEWGLLPDIGLYMDQVQTYIDRQLALYRRDENDRLLTPAMINNYIKDNVIPRAEIKKYNPTHLALLIMIGTLKQVLSIPNLSHLLSVYREPADVEVLYNHYRQIQQGSLQNIVEQVGSEISKLRNAGDGSSQATNDAMRSLALELSIEARTRILIAEKILALIAESWPDDNADKKKDKSKEKPKKSSEEA